MVQELQLPVAGGRDHRAVVGDLGVTVGTGCVLRFLVYS